MSDADTLARHEAKTEPPVVWRNWWHNFVDVTAICGCGAALFAKAGKTRAHCPHPTKEEAEQAAAKAMLENITVPGRVQSSYLGAYPELAP